MIRLFPWLRLECPTSALGNAGPEILKSNNKNQLKIKSTQNQNNSKFFKNEVKAYKSYKSLPGSQAVPVMLKISTSLRVEEPSHPPATTK